MYSQIRQIVNCLIYSSFCCFIAEQLHDYKWRVSSSLSGIPSSEFSQSGDVLQSDHVETQSAIQSQKSEVVSEQEVAELSGVLSDLKSLALEVQKETDVQNEKLGKLTGTVVDADERIRETEKRVNKLL